MPAKPQYYHDLANSVNLLDERVVNLRQETENLKTATAALKQAQADLRHELLKELMTKNDLLKETIAEVRREAAVVNQKLETLTKHIDEWDRRWWGLIALLIGALLSLASGLIVALVKS